MIVRADRGKELYVLTNNHVVEGAQPEKINVFLKNGVAIQPVRIWLDAKADVGVLGLGRDDLPAARLGDSDATAVGSWAGPNTPNHAFDSKPGTASPIAGRSGNAGCRCALVTP